MDFWWRLLRVPATGLLAEMRRHYRREDVRWGLRFESARGL